MTESNPWQSIETAPKDGRRILISDGEDIFAVRWIWRFSYPGQLDARSGFWSGPFYHMEPTLWAPCPLLPKGTPALTPGEPG